MSTIPHTIRVRILSEEVEAIGISPVVSQDMPVQELTALMLGVAGAKDAARLLEIFARGTLVSGASRFRWEPLDIAASDMDQHLSLFPDPEPHRAFDASRCTLLVIRGLTRPLAIERAAGEKRRLFRRSSFWEAALAIAAPVATYQTYSYRERADVYRAALDAAARFQLRDAAKLLPWSSYEQQIRGGLADTLELLTPRP